MDIPVYTGWRISKDTIQTYFTENIQERANAACMCVLSALYELLRILVTEFAYLIITFA